MTLQQGTGAPQRADADTIRSLHRLDDLEALARAQLEPSVDEFLAGGAGDDSTVERNRQVFQQWLIRPRIMRDVRDVDTATTVLGDRIDLPLMIAPSSLQRLYHPEGELATARAAADAHTLMVLSMNASTALEEVAAAGDRLWLQLYVYEDRAITEELVARAAEAGYRALCLTVDSAVLAWRARELRRPLQIPPEVTFAHIPPPPHPRVLEAGLTWDTLAWLRGLSNLPIVLKGVLDPGDAALAAEHGVDAIIVSNHGGRQLSGSVSPLDVLPAIVEAVDGRLEVLADGGVRSGADLFKVLALGARAGLIGRPAIWGLAAGGATGVRRAIDIIGAEFFSAMGSTGCTTTDQIGPHLVQRAS